MSIDVLELYCNDFLEKSNENYNLYEFLNSENKFIGWQIVTIFYSALCLAKAYLYKKGIPINSLNSHKGIKAMLNWETYSKKNNILFYYEKLYQKSRDARYSCKKMNDVILNDVLKNYKIVKELLMENY